MRTNHRTIKNCHIRRIGVLLPPLRSFPFDKIKIDRSFVKDLVERSDCVAIVRAISGLGRSLNITTTAEGVETTINSTGCAPKAATRCRAFLFSAAKPASEMRNCWLVLVRGSRRQRKSSRVQTRPGLPARGTAQLLLFG